MGTIVVIDVYAAAGRRRGRTGEEISGQLAEAVAILHRADEIFSTWKPDSPVSRLRRGELSRAQAPAEVAEILDLCAVARDLSGGWFDPWAVPGGFDPSGYVKGWAAQHALAAFRAGICGVLVNAAGDIASSGGLGTGTPFRIGIADPFAPLRLAEIVELTGAIATSGTYERGEHLIDPRSGRPAARAASASVTGPDLGLADALATALAVAGEQGLALIDGLDGYEALVINPDGSSGGRRISRSPPRTYPRQAKASARGVACAKTTGSARQLALVLPRDLQQRSAQRRGATRQRPPVDRTMESPIARPGRIRAACSARWNRSKIRGRCPPGCRARCPRPRGHPFPHCLAPIRARPPTRRTVRRCPSARPSAGRSIPVAGPSAWPVRRPRR